MSAAAPAVEAVLWRHTLSAAGTNAAVPAAGTAAAIDTAMGGRVAEEILNGPMKVTTGAGGDFEQATKLARMMAMRFGMTDLGLTSHEASDDMSPARRAGACTCRVGGACAACILLRCGMLAALHQCLHRVCAYAAIDAEVEKILQESYKRVQSLLAKNKSKLDALAAALLEHETLSGEECIAVIEGKPLAAPGKKASSVKQQQRKKEPETSSASSAAAKAADAAKKGAQRPRLGGMFGSAAAAPSATPAANAAPTAAAGAATGGAAAVAPADAAAAAAAPAAAAPAAAETTTGQRKTRWG